VEIKPASSLVVSLNKTLTGIEISPPLNGSTSGNLFENPYIYFADSWQGNLASHKLIQLYKITPLLLITNL